MLAPCLGELGSTGLGREAPVMVVLASSCGTEARMLALQRPRRFSGSSKENRIMPVKKKTKVRQWKRSRGMIGRLRC